MKLKLLLTICLLLITSQVFAKKITLYSCSTETDARSCNNCKKLGYMNIKVNVNTNKILMQYIYKDDSGESITNTYLQTVKHEDSNMLGSERMQAWQLFVLKKKPLTYLMKTIGNICNTRHMCIHRRFA